MKFELTEPNQQYSDSELIDDLRLVAKRLGKNWLTQREYNKNGQFSYQTQKKRFGSWLKALDKAGLEQGKRSWGGEYSETSIPEHQLIDDMQRVAEKLNKKAITIAEYDEHGQFGSATISRRYSGWNNAKKAAYLEITRLYNSSDEDYFDNILNVWQKLGHQPKYQEMTAPISKLNISSYERKFGTWRSALEKFIEYINSKDESFEPEKTIASNEISHDIYSKNEHKISYPQKEKKPQKRTSRVANLRQRFRVMKRDGFKCVLCGVSPATSIGAELHIDHIIPWSQGGETIEENLRTLCFQCNLGRSNKE